MDSRGAFLKAARRNKGYKQRQLAEILNVTTRTIQRYESNEGEISLSAAVTLSKILDVDIYDLARRNFITPEATSEDKIVAHSSA